MNVHDSELWHSDLDEVIAELSELQFLSGKRVLVTGGAGLVCSAVVDILIRWNETRDEKINVCVAGRNLQRIRERFTPYDREKWFRTAYYDALSPNNSLTFECEYVIHGAGAATPNRIAKTPVETLMGAVLGTKTLLDFARDASVAKFLYVSSSEVYGRKENVFPFREEDYGFVDLLNPRNAYPIGKRCAETLCASYSREYGVETTIVRPGHIYGPTATETDDRVASIWSYAAARGEDIVMKSDGEQIRSYCYCLDCASAIIKVLTKGKTRCAYNVSNPDSIASIKKVAEVISQIADVNLIKCDASYDEKLKFNPMLNSSLASDCLLNLGWKGLFDLNRGFSHTISIMKELLK